MNSEKGKITLFVVTIIFLCVSVFCCYLTCGYITSLDEIEPPEGTEDNFYAGVVMMLTLGAVLVVFWGLDVVNALICLICSAFVIASKSTWLRIGGIVTLTLSIVSAIFPIIINRI